MFSDMKGGLIQSMTGYGESSCEAKGFYLRVSIRSVNSKHLDLDSHLPYGFDKEGLLWRALFSERLKRGKIVFNLHYQVRDLRVEDVLNEELLRSYGQFLEELCTSLDIHGDVLNVMFRLPGVMHSGMMYKVDEAVTMQARQHVLKAVERCVKSREEEGLKLSKQIIARFSSLRKVFSRLDEYVAKQEAILRARLEERFQGQDLTPQARDQEVIACLGKASIEEEKVRFYSHLDFFEKTFQAGGVVGKKLSFIAQELSRELNTIGAKAQYIPLRHLVVDMKSTLEEIKEQLANLV